MRDFEYLNNTTDDYIPISQEAIDDALKQELEVIKGMLRDAPTVPAADKTEAIKELFRPADEESSSDMTDDKTVEYPVLSFDDIAEETSVEETVCNNGQVKDLLNDPRYIKYMKKLHRRKKRNALFSYIFDALSLCLKTMLLCMFFLNTIIELTYVPSTSMVPTLQVQDIEISSKLHYFFKAPERGDIVIFYRDNDPKFEKLLTKRVIGIPGDKIEIKNKILYINDVAYNEPYLAKDAGENFGPVTVPEDQYFMLGDNRYYSLDARFWEETFVSSKNIIGKVIYILHIGDGDAA